MVRSKDFYQNVHITLSDGRIGHFTGRVLVDPGESVTVTDVVFTEPAIVQQAYVFEEVKNITHKRKKEKS